jgi:uncharacterized protein (DUF2062 family)
MTDHEEAKWIGRHHRRVRWIKRLLRVLPSRANIHRYPGLKWASAMTRKRMYLWSFRYREVAPALYAGSILSFLPLMGLHTLIAFALALLLRANFPIIIALGFITNWVTAVPFYYICYEIGRFSLKLFDIHVEALGIEELRLFMENLLNQNWADNGHFLLRVFGVTSLGGLILGSFIGTVLDQIYRLMAWRAAVIWNRVSAIRRKRMSEAVKAAVGQASSAPDEKQVVHR